MMGFDDRDIAGQRDYESGESLGLGEAESELEAALEYRLCLAGDAGVQEVLDIVAAVLRRSGR